jgi:hypothetical protein
MKASSSVRDEIPRALAGTRSTVDVRSTPRAMNAEAPRSGAVPECKTGRFTSAQAMSARLGEDMQVRLGRRLRGASGNDRARQDTLALAAVAIQGRPSCADHRTESFSAA